MCFCTSNKSSCELFNEACCWRWFVSIITVLWCFGVRKPPSFPSLSYGWCLNGWLAGWTHCQLQASQLEFGGCTLDRADRLPVDELECTSIHQDLVKDDSFNKARLTDIMTFYRLHFQYLPQHRTITHCPSVCSSLTAQQCWAMFGIMCKISTPQGSLHLHFVWYC